MGSKENGFVNGQILSLASQKLETVPAIFQGKSIHTLNLDYNNLRTLPNDMCTTLSSLHTLSIKGNELTELPTSLNLLCSLEELILTENDLNSLPDSMCNLCCLRKLVLTGNSLTELPATFGCLTSLEELHVDENSLRSLPDSFSRLTRLEVLELNNNELTTLPLEFGLAINVRILNLSYNEIRVIPDSFACFEKLTDLDVSHNRLEALPDAWQFSHSLKRLYADANGLKSFPKWFTALPSLEELSMCDNEFQKELPEEFGKVSVNVVHVNLAGNSLTSLSENFGNLTKIEYLHLGSVIDELERRNFQNGNWIVHLPVNFGNLHLLREARLDENQLCELPEHFGDLVCLEYLDLGQNALQELPDSFCNLQSLSYCQLSKNKLQYLPAEFGKLKKLIDLRLDNNQLLELPDSLFDLQQLQILDLFNNKLTVIPVDLKKLIHLKKLDLDENEFGLPILEVPEIFKCSKYPLRDPELKSNWRGRPRPDVSPNQYMKPEDNADSQNGEMHENFNKALKKALQNNLSLWKQEYSQTSERKKFVPMTNHANENDLELDEKTNTSDSGRSQTDVALQQRKKNEMLDKNLRTVTNGLQKHLYEERMNSNDRTDVIIEESQNEVKALTKEDCISNCIEEDEVDKDINDDEYMNILTEADDNANMIVDNQDLLNAEPEDWDKELGIEKIEDPYDDHIYMHPVAEKKESPTPAIDLFCPGDWHPLPVQKTQHFFYSVNGQFDDAEQ